MSGIPGFQFDTGWQEITFNGKQRRLDRAEAVLLGVLLEKLNQTVPREAINAALWPDGNFPSDVAATVRVRVFGLRKKLREVGVPVELCCINRGGVGLRVKQQA